MANVKNLQKHDMVEKLHFPDGKILEESTFYYSWEREDDFGTNRRYKTFAHGDGLAVWAEGAGEWKQTLGTCQFSLPANRESARKRLNRMSRR